MSNRDFPLYTVKNDCQDCYKCVRRCPVKAIKIEDNSAMIVPELCIACGICYEDIKRFLNSFTNRNRRNHYNKFTPSILLI